VVAEACVETNDLSDHDRGVLATEQGQVCPGGFPNHCTCDLRVPVLK